jgi:predicted RNase H-like HicB family nuclease
MTRQVKIIVEKHADGYVAYPLGLKGVVVGEGSSYEEALADVKSAIRFHIETFGAEAQNLAARTNGQAPAPGNGTGRRRALRFEPAKPA